MVDVMALGALNVDWIVTDGGSESSPVEDTEVVGQSEEIIARVKAQRVKYLPFHGGSAFNAMLMLAQLRLADLSLGFIGIDTAPWHGITQSHMDRLRRLHVEVVTKSSTGKPGLCISIPGHHGRIAQLARAHGSHP